MNRDSKCGELVMSRLRNSTASTVIMIILALGLVGGGTFSYIQSGQIVLLEENNSQLETDLLDLQSEYNELQSDYDDLLDNYSTLFNNYASLYTEYTELEEQYGSLTLDYEELFEAYVSLYADYTALLHAFEDPLDTVVVPTINEFRDWLYDDDTDECQYVTDQWMCGDFAAMLMTRAKTMNYRVRIVTIFYSFEGETGYGSTTDIYGSGGHAFNVIYCSDGIYYIEPQTDAVWSFGDASLEMMIHHYYNFESYTGSVWDGYIFWSNFWGEFG